MTIAQAIESSGPGGAEQVLLRLCCRQRDAGHRVLPLLLRPGWLKDRLEAEGFEVTVAPLSAPLDRRFARRLAQFLRAARVDVLHSHEITFAAYGRVATLGLGIAHVATAHGGNFAGGWKRRSLGALLLRGTSRFRLVAVSADLADRLARSFLVDRGTITVLENGVDLPAPRPVAARAAGEPFRIVVVGNLYPVKDHGTLIRAVAALAASGVDAEMDILGRGQEEAGLRALIGELGLAERVRLRGFRMDVGAFLGRAHVLASSSRFEAMPLSFLEAMGYSLPIAATRVGGVPALVEDGATGLLYEPGDPEAAAAALGRLAADDELRRRLGAEAARRAHGRFDAATMVRRYLSLYGELAGGRLA